MDRPPLDYQSRPVPPVAPHSDWRRRRIGTVSLAIAGLVVLGLVASFGVAVAFDLSGRVMDRFLRGCAVTLLAGSAVGVFGTDFDRERRFVYVGVFLNLALLPIVGLLWLGCMLGMKGS